MPAGGDLRPGHTQGASVGQKRYGSRPSWRRRQSRPSVLLLRAFCKLADHPAAVEDANELPFGSRPFGLAGLERRLTIPLAPQIVKDLHLDFRISATWALRWCCPGRQHR